MEFSRYVCISIVVKGSHFGTHIERNQLLPVLIELVVIELGELLCGVVSALFWRRGIRISARNICGMLQVQSDNANRDFEALGRGVPRTRDF